MSYPIYRVQMEAPLLAIPGDLKGRWQTLEWAAAAAQSMVRMDLGILALRAAQGLAIVVGVAVAVTIAIMAPPFLLFAPALTMTIVGGVALLEQAIRKVTNDRHAVSQWRPESRWENEVQELREVSQSVFAYYKETLGTEIRGHRALIMKMADTVRQLNHHANRNVGLHRCDPLSGTSAYFKKIRSLIYDYAGEVDAASREFLSISADHERALLNCALGVPAA